jgi:hypothetical protein
MTLLSGIRRHLKSNHLKVHRFTFSLLIFYPKKKWVEQINSKGWFSALKTFLAFVSRPVLMTQYGNSLAFVWKQGGMVISGSCNIRYGV